MNWSEFLGEPISCYSRVQALTDGMLSDSAGLARQCGFRYPVALTAAAWAACVTVPDAGQEHTEAERLSDLLLALRDAVLTSDPGQEVRFEVVVRC